MVVQYLALGSLNILALLELCYMVGHNDLLEKKMRSHFVCAAFCTILTVLAELGCTIFDGGILNSFWMHTLCNTIGFSVSPLISIFVAFAFCGHSLKTHLRFAIPALINIVFAVLSPAFGLIFTVTPQNEYYRGGFFFVYILAYIWSMMLLFRETFRIVRRYQHKNRITLVLLFVLLALGTTVQVVVPFLHTAWTCITLALAIYYAYFCDLSQKYDPLTDLFNRRAYECELQRLERLGSAGIILFDVDNFKTINDSFGHPIGDLCLIRIANLIKEVFGEIGVGYRIGGDEFAVLSQSRDQIRIRNAVATFKIRMLDWHNADSKMPLISIGYAFYQTKSESIQLKIKEADSHLYRHKQNTNTKIQ